MTAFMPEAHTLLTVVHTVLDGSPAPNAACLAGACNAIVQDWVYAYIVEGYII